MPQPSIVEAVHQVGDRAPRPSDLALVVIECHRERRAEVYRQLAAMPVRVLAIEEPAAMK